MKNVLDKLEGTERSRDFNVNGSLRRHHRQVVGGCHIEEAVTARFLYCSSESV